MAREEFGNIVKLYKKVNIILQQKEDVELRERSILSQKEIAKNVTESIRENKKHLMERDLEIEELGFRLSNFHLEEIKTVALKLENDYITEVI